MTPNLNVITQHLNKLFGDIREHDDGLIEIAYSNTNSPAVNKATLFTLENIEKAAQFAFDKNTNEGVNVYVGAALRKPETFPGARTTKKDYYASSFIWCDMDDKTAAEEAKTKYNKLPPSFVVVTGRHPHLRVQAWWRLAIEEQDIEKLEHNLDFACKALSGDPAVVDAARVMRLAGTIAWPKKEGRVPELTELATPNNATKIIFGEKFKDYFELSGNPTALTQNNTNNNKKDLTGRFKINELLEATRQEGQWHLNMRDAISSMVGRGWSNEQIVIATNPYRRDKSLTEDLISPLITSAREKWGVAEPEASILKPLKSNPEQTDIQEYFTDVSNMTWEPRADDFVQGLLTKGGFSVVYGESNCGKTFFIFDIAFHVAEGREWNGRRVNKGNVVYICLEGSRGLEGRVQAYKKEINPDITGLLISQKHIDFITSEEDIDELERAINTAKEKLGDISLVVVDTLARALGGADENSGQDMGLLVKHADYIRKMTGAHICFVHHTGKDKLKGARGHSSLRAAVDTEIEISREEGSDYSNIKVVKQRDLKMDEDRQFKLKQVVLGVNSYGEDITSCVVEPYKATAEQKTVKMNDVQKFIYDSLIDALQRHGTGKRVYGKDGPFVQCVTYDELREVMEERGFKEVMATENKTTAQQIKSATQSARLYLQRHNKISFDGQYVWVIKEKDY